MLKSNTFLFTIKQRFAERKFLILGAVCALLLAQLMFGGLVLSSLYNQFRMPITSLNSILVENVAQNLSRMARLGRVPERVQKLDQLIEEYKGKSLAQAFLITNGEDKIIASWDITSIGDTFTPKSDAQAVFNTVKEFTSQNIIWDYQEILDRNNEVVGNVLLGLEQKTLFQAVFASAKSLIINFLLISVLATILLLILALGLSNPIINESKRFPKMRLYFCFVIPLILAQACFLYTMREPIALEHTKELTYLGTQVAERLTKDINKVVNMGVELQDIPSFDSYTMNLQLFLPLINAIAILDSQDNILSVTNNEQKLDIEKWHEKLDHTFSYSSDIVKIENGIENKVGSVKVLIDKKIVAENILAITIDILTMTVVAILFLIEIVILLLLKEEQLMAKVRKPLVSYPSFIRPVIFFSMVAIDAPLSFISLRMQEISPVLWNIPPDVVMSLPVSSELFMVGFAIFICGFLSEKIGWRRMLIIGTSFVFMGSIASALVTQPLTFILARAIAGFGYGTINIAAQLFIIANSPADKRAGNLSIMYAGLFAGGLCGIPVGGLIAERFGYTSVFYASALIILCVAITLLCTIFKQYEKIEKVELTPEKESGFVAKDFFAFVFDRRIFSLLFFSILPLAFVSACLFQYFVPITLSNSGKSPATISRVTMFFFIIVVYLGPIFAGVIDITKNKIYLICLAGIFAVASLLSFVFFDGLIAAVCSMGFLGLCNAIISSGHATYALEQKVSVQFGAARSAAVYNLVERLGQVLGPISLGVMLTLLGTSNSLITIAVFILVLSILFVVVSKVKQCE